MASACLQPDWSAPRSLQYILAGALHLLAAVYKRLGKAPRFLCGWLKQLIPWPEYIHPPMPVTRLWHLVLSWSRIVQASRVLHAIWRRSFVSGVTDHVTWPCRETIGNQMATGLTESGYLTMPGAPGRNIAGDSATIYQHQSACRQLCLDSFAPWWLRQPELQGPGHDQDTAREPSVWKCSRAGQRWGAHSDDPPVLDG